MSSSPPESGWENADGTPFEEHYLDWDGARYIESGGQNVGLHDLIDNHVVPEGEHLESLELEFSDVETHSSTRPTQRESEESAEDADVSKAAGAAARTGAQLLGARSRR